MTVELVTPHRDRTSSDTGLPATKAASIRVAGLSKAFSARSGDVAALRDIDLEIARGEIFAIIGRSGAGKSTLIRCLNRLERPNAGQIWINGIEITALEGDQLRAARRRIGMIFQTFNLAAQRSAFDNVALPLVLAGERRKRVEARVMELLDLVGLADRRNAFPAELSGGQKQRVGIARALATAPLVLLCDEATSALDPETTSSVLDLLQAINRQMGLTIVLVTHEMSVVRRIAQRVLVLDQGRIIEQGEVATLFSAPQHAVTRELLRVTPDADGAWLRVSGGPDAIAGALSLLQANGIAVVEGTRHE
jgi:D-methionine transport system ATP-binding protein